MPRFRLLAAVAMAAALAACGGASSENGADTASAAAQNPDTDVSDAVASAQSAATREMALGDPEAPLTIIEYASVTCPHCADFHEDVFKEIKTRYIDTGEVRFVFRELFTPPAQLSAAGFVLARCAAEDREDDAYFNMLDAMFRTQRSWLTGGDPREGLLRIANASGLDEEAFNTCLQRQDILDHLNAVGEEANERYDITGTPSFLFNGEKITVNPLTLENFEAVVAEQLAEASGGAGAE